jgi:hypothetical protein
MHGADPPEKRPSSRSIDGRGSDLPGTDTATYATRVETSSPLVFPSGQSVNSPSSVRSVLVGKVGKQGSSGRSRSRRRGRGRRRLSAINGPEQSPPEARDAMLPLPLPLPPPCHRLNTSPQSVKYARRRHISAQQCRRPIAGYINSL